jgi:hypothetical protein
VISKRRQTALRERANDNSFEQRLKGGTRSVDSGGPAFLESGWADGFARNPAVSAFPERVIGSACASSFSRLARRLILWGIASRLWPLRVQDCGQHAIYTRLDAETDWIQKIVEQLRASQID